MKTLDDILRFKVQREGVTHLSLIYTDGEFRASFSPSKTCSTRFAASADPVKVLIDVLTARSDQEMDFG